MASRYAACHPFRRRRRIFSTWLSEKIHEALEFFTGKGPVARLAFVLGDVGSGVPFVADLDGVGSEAGQALLHPPIPRVGHKAHEDIEVALVVADGGVRPATCGRLGEVVVDIARGPVPGVVIGEPLEAPDHLLTHLDRVWLEHAAQLLASPAFEHRLKQSFLHVT